MRVTDGRKITELLYQIVASDKTNMGVAKARFAGEAGYSVPSLERLMRGEHASESAQHSTVKAARERGFKVSLDDLFPLARTRGKAS